MQDLVRRFLIAAVVAALVTFSFVTHERVIESADVMTEARETIDIGDRVVAVVDGDTRVAYSVTRSVVHGEGVTAEQRNGRAIYRVRDGALHVRSSGGAIEVQGDAMIVVDRARYAVAEGSAAARNLYEDPSLLRWLDEVNNAPGGDLVERLAELERMRAELRARE